MTQTPEEKKLLDNIVFPLTVINDRAGGYDIFDSSQPDPKPIIQNRNSTLGEMICKALNHYYAAPSVDVEQRAEEYATEKMKVVGEMLVDSSTTTDIIKTSYIDGSRDLGQMEQWVSFASSPPKDYDRVLYVDDRDNMLNIGYFVLSQTKVDYVTKWQPLPKL